ncbi:MAG: NAD-dependent epimerase/dehydratase family protein, partial [Gammaproteobacteria bacterium]
IARGEEIKLVDGGAQRRSFTNYSDGISALMKMIENKDGVASGQIYNIGNPANDLSVRELATLMLEIATEFPEYRAGAEKVKLVEVKSEAYYGKGYQDVQTRVPYIGNTRDQLGWEPGVGVEDALRGIFEAYRHEVAEARALLDDESGG